MKLSHLLPDVMLPASLDPEILDLVLDSRKVKPGDLFFACAGSQLDGSKFIDEAIRHGASAVLVEAGHSQNLQHTSVPVIPIPHLKNLSGKLAACFYGFPTKQMRIIGVTGTSGKTSCTQFIGSLLQRSNIPCGVIGTLGSGLYGHLQPSELTTPDALTLQKTFADFVKKSIPVTAMEVSSHSLDQGRVNGIEFEIGIFTNLTRDHLDYHQTMEAYGAAKKRLFSQTKCSIVNLDDPYSSEIIKSISSSQKVLGFSTQKKSAEIFIETVNFNFNGIEGYVVTPWGEGRFFAPLLGQFHLKNILAALSAVCLLEVPFSDVLECISQLESVPGRMQIVGGAQQPLVVIDYAHKPDALEKVLIELRQHCEGKLFCVFGCGGERDRGKRSLMANIAERYADQVIVTDDNPRHENPEQIVAEIMQGFVNPTKIIIEHDRSKAIRDVIHYATAGDCILIAGKGAETYQLIGDERVPFSDIEKVKKVLANEPKN